MHLVELLDQVLGDVVMYVRDTTPPGQGSSVADFIDWADDAKNHGPYPTYDPAGVNTFLVPPVRPGHTYYLGFRAVTDATFSLRYDDNAYHFPTNGAGVACGPGGVCPAEWLTVLGSQPTMPKAQTRDWYLDKQPRGGRSEAPQ